MSKDPNQPETIAPARQSLAAHRVLITRPQPAADRFAAELASVFGAKVVALISPLMRVEFLPVTPPDLAFEAVILTSETGAKAAGQMAGLPRRAFCVGDRTAQAAAEAGFEALSAAGAAADLVALIETHPTVGPMLYLHGEDRAADVGSLLPHRQICSLICYRQRSQPLTPEALTLLGAPDAGSNPVIVPLLSPRSARLFAAAYLEIDSDLPKAAIRPVVISQNAYDALPVSLAHKALIARHPDAASVILAIGELISAPAS